MLSDPECCCNKWCEESSKQALQQVIGRGAGSVGATGPEMLRPFAGGAIVGFGVRSVGVGPIRNCARFG